MQPSAPPDPLEEITLRVRDLEITVTVRAVGSGVASSGSGIQVESTPTPPAVEAGATGPGPEPYQELYPISSGLEDRVIRACTAHDLGQLNLPFLDHLVSRLRAEDRVWNPRARVARAFRAGLVARLRLNGVYSGEASPGIPFRNSYYVVLRCLDLPHGFWTNNYQTYHIEVSRGALANQDFHPDSVSQAFPSHSECEAYLAGARRPWPPQLR